MEKKKNDKKNLTIGIMILIIIILVGLCVYLMFINKEQSDDNDVLYTVTLKTETIINGCVGGNDTYKELYINDKKIDLGFTNNSNACKWVYINSYKENGKYIVLDVDNGYVEGVRELYVVNYNGNIIKHIGVLESNRYIENYYFENNNLYIEAYVIDNRVCSLPKTDIYGGLYKLEYNNDTLGEIKKVGNKTVKDYLKTSNVCQ